MLGIYKNETKEATVILYHIATSHSYCNENDTLKKCTLYFVIIFTLSTKKQLAEFHNYFVGELAIRETPHLTVINSWYNAT